jgi:hypothetical protein
VVPAVALVVALVVGLPVVPEVEVEVGATLWGQPVSERLASQKGRPSATRELERVMLGF